MEEVPREDVQIEDVPQFQGPLAEEFEAENLREARRNMTRNLVNPINVPSENDGGPWDACRAAVSELFPDMCPNHVLALSTKFHYNHESVILHVLEQQENGDSYPTKPRESVFKAMKRKRADEEEMAYESELSLIDESAVAESSWAHFPSRRVAEKNHEAYEQRNRLGFKDKTFRLQYAHATRTLLKNAFPNLYVQDITNALDANTGLLYPSFLALEKEYRQAPEDRNLRSKTSKRVGKFVNIYEDSPREAEQLVDAEFKAAKAWLLVMEDEAKNMEVARAEGAVVDCGCCFDECAQNSMVHCNGAKVHWFCVNCARQNAEVVLGDGRYELCCMSTDGCAAGFSRDQKDRFLDADTEMGLDKVEQETILRLANIEGLASCPFCPFAALLPPAEEDRVFECQNDKCLKASCRLCKQETHIPKTCEEVARENNGHVRHRIEEAMSEALIRRCNKCGTPFIKDAGCNKMTCMAPGCKNVQCYVCSKSCTGYEHFNDPNRGGVVGNCPLFDDQDKRHEDEVRVAEEKARQQAREENSDLDEKTWQKVAGPLQAGAGADRLQQELEAIVAHAPPRPPPANRNPAPNQNPGRANPGPAVPSPHVGPAHPARPAHPALRGPPVGPGLPPVANPGGPAKAVPHADQLFGQDRGVLGELDLFYNPWLAAPRQNGPVQQGPVQQGPVQQGPVQQGPVHPPGVPPPGFSPYGDQRAFLGIQDPCIQNANAMAALADRQAALEQMVNRLQQQRQQPKLEAYVPVLRPSQLPPPVPRARAPPLDFPPFLMGRGSRPDNIGLLSIQGGAQSGARIPALRRRIGEDVSLILGKEPALDVGDSSE